MSCTTACCHAIRATSSTFDAKLFDNIDVTFSSNTKRGAFVLIVLANAVFVYSDQGCLVAARKNGRKKGYNKQTKSIHGI